ncbi:alpha-N-acetylglucosaminidase TIM-barrel domain-containing protein [Bacteroides thetaiotaomicron]|uniref:alpha-N-acetylglucosaminidase TIM-barrel domain-containing protein n=1 Tax=Bacteroides thetaiotaomicron TaxID=818 RepID=UPI0035AE8DE5
MAPDHIYGIDPFNEVDSPNWNEDFLAKVSKKIYESIYQVDAEAKWLQMTWMFYHDQKKWTQPRIRSFLEAVPDDKLILLDYYCDSTEIWRNTEMYYGKPYMWCYLGNFGGNSMMVGNLDDVDVKIEKLFCRRW